MKTRSCGIGVMAAAIAVLLLPVVVSAAEAAQSQVRVEQRSTDGGQIRIETRSTDGGPPVVRTWINGKELQPAEAAEPGPAGDPARPGPRIMINGAERTPGRIMLNAGPPRGTVKVDPADMEKMQAEIQAVEKAIKDLQAKAAAVLGDEAIARRFTMQQVTKLLTPPRPPAIDAAAEAPQAPDAATRKPE